MFNKGGEKEKEWLITHPNIHKFNKNFHSHQNLLTYDNLHQVSQIFQLEIKKFILRHIYSFGNEADIGHFRPTFMAQRSIFFPKIRI